jgi:hypothetical protein
MRERIAKDTEFYVMVDGLLHPKIAGMEFPVLYIDHLFKGDFMEKYHSEMSHIIP